VRFLRRGMTLGVVIFWFCRVSKRVGVLASFGDTVWMEYYRGSRAAVVHVLLQLHSSTSLNKSFFVSCHAASALIIMTLTSFM
jgi:hypothetical protein